MAGLELDPWQQHIITNSLGEREDGKWAAYEVAAVVPRQNGKGGILEARELAGLFLLEERLIVHSAHQFDTSLEAFRRLLALIEGTDDLRRRVKRVSRSHGEEGIELLSGQRIRFRTRTKGGGRGFTGDCLILDEAMIIDEPSHGALLPTLSARPNPQVWYTGSAVDQWVHEHGVVFARVRERGIKGDDPALAYFEWSADADDPEKVTPDMALDPAIWAQANPALGIRISTEHISREQRSMSTRTFAVERLNVGDWPRTDEFGEQVIHPNIWADLDEEASQLVGPICFAVDVSPDRGKSSIAAAGLNQDDLDHVEVIENKTGTGWVGPRLQELIVEHRPLGIYLDGKGPAAALITQFENLGIEVELLDAQEYARACGEFFDACDQDQLRHIGQAVLTNAIKGCARRPLGEAWAWSRKKSTTDITPLVACTIARWGAHQHRESVYETRGMRSI